MKTDKKRDNLLKREGRERRVGEEPNHTTARHPGPPYIIHFSLMEYLQGSVADPGCLSRIPDPDFYPFRIPDLGSRIPDPKTATKEKGEKNLLNLFL
jgi:hypothetical protein